MRWSEIRIIDKVLKEKYIYLYIWGVNSVYIIYELAYLVPRFSLLVGYFLPDVNVEDRHMSISVPVFIALGFLQAICYHIAHHIYNKACPEMIKSNWSKDQVDEKLEAQRDAIVKTTLSVLSSIYSIKRAGWDDSRLDLIDKIGQEESEKIINKFTELALMDEKNKIIEQSEKDVRAATYAGKNLSNHMYRYICTAMYFMSGVFGFAHIYKVSYWIFKNIA